MLLRFGLPDASRHRHVISSKVRSADPPKIYAKLDELVQSLEVHYIDKVTTSTFAVVALLAAQSSRSRKHSRIGLRCAARHLSGQR
jgi:hypothetical protein